MFLPGTYVVALVIMIAGMIFWGSWPNTYKLTQRWRIELYYWDYAFGIFLTSIIVGLTLGTFFGETTFTGNLRGANHCAWVYAAAAGAFWDCGNILMMLGVSLVGLAVAFLLSIGLALVFGAVGSYMVMPRGSPVLHPLKSFGGYGVVRIPDLQRLLHYVCNNGYEHHVCVNYGNHAGAIANALHTYKGWEVYQHENAKHR